MTAASVTFRNRYVCSQCHAVFRQSFARCPLDGSEIRSTDEDPFVGLTLADRYAIEGCIGEGGMGRVYRAKHTRMSRHFAIKVLYGDLAADETNRKRFEREAEAACRLSHPNLIAMVDFGKTSGGLLYLAMEYVDGQSLRQLIAEQAPFDTDRATSLLRQMAAGLEHAHGRSLVHRDFKPDNVILAHTEDGEIAKILDFGIARIVEEGTAKQLTTEGVLMGTPAYMAPEQAMGQAVDHRADLFSLGMVLYEMVTQMLPFDGDPMTVLRQNLIIETPPMSVRSGLTVEPLLEVIAARLLAKQPDNRFQSARELIDAIDEWWVPTRGPRLSTRPGASGPMPRTVSTPSMAFFPTEMSTPGPGDLPAGDSLPDMAASPVPTIAPEQKTHSRKRRALIAIGGLVAAGALLAAIGLFRGSDTAAGTSADAAAVAMATAPDAGQDDAAAMTASSGHADAAIAPDTVITPDAAIAATTAPPRDRTTRPKKRTREPREVTLAEYRRLYGNVLQSFQNLYQKTGADSPLAGKVSALRRQVEALSYNPDQAKLAREYQAMRRLDRQIQRLLRRAGK